MKLRKTHYEQLLYYCEDRKENGCYYGNKEQFWKRHDELVEWLEKLIEEITE